MRPHGGPHNASWVLLDTLPAKRRCQRTFADTRHPPHHNLPMPLEQRLHCLRQPGPFYCTVAEPQVGWVLPLDQPTGRPQGKGIIWVDN